jgi:predicted TIM-barrel fold metal-dependent hydrolase
MAGASTLGMISADSHVNEPRDLWLANLPSNLRDQAMQGIVPTTDGGWDLILDGRHIGKAGSSEAERLEVLKPEHRLRILREEGIAGECIYPTIGLYVWALTDPDGGKVSCRIYNEWIVDQLESRSPRFRCAGLVPTWRVEDAIEEVRFIAAQGLAAAMLPSVVEPTWNHRQWEPLWAAIAETGLPVVMHQGTGHSMIWYRGPGATVANLMATQTIAPRTATMLATSGVLERHPDLHVVFVEYNAGWLAWTMSTIDFYTESFKRYGTTDNMGSSRIIGKDKPPKPVIWPELAEPPSFYLARQVHGTFQDDPVAIANLPITGPGPLMWGSDYPHEEGTYPWSKDTVDRLSAPLGERDTELVFRDTAARIFRFDPEVLATPA